MWTIWRGTAFYICSYFFAPNKKLKVLHVICVDYFLAILFIRIKFCASLTDYLFCVYFSFVALTAPGFGVATTTAAAPATGFSFGSTNTGKMHVMVKAKLLSLVSFKVPVFLQWISPYKAFCHLTPPCHSLFLAACLRWLQDLGGWELETPRLVGLVLGGLV